MSNSSVQNMVGEANTHNLTFVLQELNLFPDLILFILKVLAQTVELFFRSGNEPLLCAPPVPCAYLCQSSYPAGL